MAEKHGKTGDKTAEDERFLVGGLKFQKRLSIDFLKKSINELAAWVGVSLPAKTAACDSANSAFIAGDSKKNL